MDRPLLFLDFDDVLCLNAPLGGHDLGQAIRNVAVDGRPAREFQHVWEGVFDAACVSRLRALHEEFNLRYVVSSSWALLMNKAALQFGLRQCSLGFVVDNLHSSWTTPKDYGRARDRVGEVLAWIGAHPQEAAAWVVLDDVESGASLADWPRPGERRFVVLCAPGVGLDTARASELRTALLARVPPLP